MSMKTEYARFCWGPVSSVLFSYESKGFVDILINLITRVPLLELHELMLLSLREEGGVGRHVLVEISLLIVGDQR